MKFRLLICICFFSLLTVTGYAQNKKAELAKRLDDYLTRALITLSPEWGYEEAINLLHLLEGDHPRKNEWEPMVAPFREFGKITKVRILKKEIKLGSGRSASINTKATVKIQLEFENGKEAFAECILYTRGRPWKLENIRKLP